MKKHLLFTGLILPALCFMALLAPSAEAASIVVTEEYTHRMRPGDSRDTALYYARWEATGKVFHKAVQRIKEEAGLPVMPTGMEEAMLSMFLVPELNSINCGGDYCKASVTLAFESAQAEDAIRAILLKPDLIAQFRQAQKEGGADLARADALSGSIGAKSKVAKAAKASDDDIKEYKQAVFRGFAWNWYFQGTALALDKRDFEALEAFSRFLGRIPRYARAYFSRGALYAKLGRHKDALSDYSTAVDLAPGDASAYNNRGVAYYNLTDYRRAELDFTRAIKLDPLMASAYNNRGNVYLDDGKPDDAIKDYNRALELDPEYAEAYNSRGTAHNTLENPDLALLDFTRATELAPDYPDAFNNRGVTLHRKGLLAEAIDNYTHAIQIKATYAEAYSNRGVAFQQQGNLRQAHMDYSSAITLTPDYAGAYLNRAILNMQLKDPATACLDAGAACRLGDCRAKKKFARTGQCKRNK